MYAVKRGENNDNYSAIRSRWLQRGPDSQLSHAAEAAARQPCSSAPFVTAQLSSSAQAALRAATQLQHIATVVIQTKGCRWLRSPPSSHSVLQIRKRKRITGCGNPSLAFTPHVCPHTYNFAPVSQLGLRL